MDLVAGRWNHLEAFSLTYLTLRINQRLVWVELSTPPKETGAPTHGLVGEEKLLPSTFLGSLSGSSVN